MTTKTLSELATVLRSKNAGPLWLTLDLIFPSEQIYRAVLESGALTPEAVAVRYGSDPEQVSVIGYGPVNSVKVTLPRKFVSGDPGDSDVYGCQQHLPLAEMQITAEFPPENM